MTTLGSNATLSERLHYCPYTVSIETLIEMAEKVDAFDEFVDNRGTLADVESQLDEADKFTNIHETFGIDTAVELEMKLRALDTLKYRAQDLLDMLEEPLAHADDVACEVSALRAFLEEISK